MSEYVYMNSLDHARREDEVQLWRNSFKENIRCKNAVEKALSEGFDGMHLKEGIAKNLAEEFGTDRLSWVLANTVKEHFEDGRFRPENKEWAKNIYIPKDSHNVEFAVSSHPEIVNGLITDYRQYSRRVGTDIITKNRLYVIEHRYDTRESALSDFKERTELCLDGICEDVFGDG